jgi:hypothetical protein
MMVILHEDGYITDMDNIQIRIKEDIKTCKSILKERNIDQETAESLVNNVYENKQELCRIDDILNTLFDYIVILEKDRETHTSARRSECYRAGR